MGLAVLAGIIVGIVSLRGIARLPLAPRHPVSQLLGMRKPVVMGFVPYWLVSKVENTSLATLNEVTYFGLVIERDGHLQKKVSDQENEPGWHALQTGKFTELISKRPQPFLDKSLLVHLANEASISALLSDPTTHAQNLILDAEPLMKQYKFTDLNLDIESFRIASPSAQAQMSTFLQEIKRHLVEKKLGTLTTELTVASLVNSHLLQPEIVGNVSDRVVLMAYDFHYRGSTIAGPVAPTGGAKEKWEYDVKESIALAIQVIPSEKILLGIPLYGYEWETLSNTPESPVIPGTGKTSTLLRVEELKKNCDGCEVQRDEQSGTPYLILPPNDESSIQQIYFEDEVSLQRKMDLVHEFHLGGIAFWAVGYEPPGSLSVFDSYKEASLQNY
jgi:spore germination protein YaaH